MEDKRTQQAFQAIHLYDMPINVTTLNSRKYLTRQKIQEFDSTWKNHKKYKNTKLHSFMKTNKFIRINLFYSHTMQNIYIVQNSCFMHNERRNPHKLPLLCQQQHKMVYFLCIYVYILWTLFPIFLCLGYLLYCRIPLKKIQMIV